jgi:hypothetical protein
MNRSDWLTDELIQAAFERRAKRAVPTDLRETILTLTAASSQRSPWRMQFRGTISTPVFRQASLNRVAAAAVIGVIAVGAAFFVTRPGEPAVGGPSPTPNATFSTSAPISPSTSPSPITAAMIWTQASLNEDWPAPVRSEPAGGAAIIQNNARAIYAVYADPVGDIDASYAWVDIRQLQGGKFIGLTERPTPVNPADRWIAYGIVVDTDRDGAPDLRFGIDNTRVTASGEQESRAWMTDLHTGRTTIDLPTGEDDGKAGFLGSWPGEGHGIGCVVASPLPSGATGPCREPLEMLTGAHLSFSGDIAGGGHFDNLRSPFYTWASVIEDGRVVATDYAPDTGWLDPQEPVPASP